jgi:hypothetical protein
LSRSLGTYIRNLERMKRWIDDRNGRALDREFGNANEVRKMLS